MRAPASGAGARVRWDWFQTAERLTLSFFVKGRQQSDVTVTATDAELCVAVALADGSIARHPFQLYAAVVPGSVSVDVRSMKVEVALRKARAGLQWPSLEASEQPAVATLSAKASASKSVLLREWYAAVADSSDDEQPVPAPMLRVRPPDESFFSCMYRVAGSEVRAAMNHLQQDRAPDSARVADVDAVISLSQQLMRSGGPQRAAAGSDTPLRAASAALSSGRNEEAAVALLSLLQHPPPSAAHAHGLGVARLARGDFCGARAAWAAGAAAFPADSTLADEMAAAAAYGVRMPGALRLARDDFEAVRGEGSGDVVWMSRSPVLGKEECDALIQASDEAARAQGGWQRARHQHPTTDIPARSIPAVLLVWKRLLDDWIAPGLSLLYPADLPDPLRLRVYDAFVAVYGDMKGAQRGLERHRDQAELTCVVHLSDPAEYEGGGTQFDGFAEPVRPRRGHVTLFRGLMHCGVPVTAGARYILTGFLYADREPALR